MATEVEVEVLKSKGNGFPPTVDHCFVTRIHISLVSSYTHLMSLNADENDYKSVGRRGGSRKCV